MLRELPLFDECDERSMVDDGKLLPIVGHALLVDERKDGIQYVFTCSREADDVKHQKGKVVRNSDLFLLPSLVVVICQ